MTAPETALVAATAAHLGFQATVTVLVYPALRRVPAGHWKEAHRAHSRGITPLVGLVYGALALTGGWALLSGPDAWTLTALAAVAVAVLVTAGAAAPAHGRLASGRDQRVLDHLLRVDRARAAAAAVALVAAVLATR